jgi:hypothetical protein
MISRVSIWHILTDLTMQSSDGGSIREAKFHSDYIKHFNGRMLTLTAMYKKKSPNYPIHLRRKS